MPSPRRGAGVTQRGTVTAVAGGTCTVTVAGITYQLPYVGSPAPGDDVWVLWAGRTGLVLAPTGCRWTCPFSAWASYEALNELFTTVVDPETVGTAPYVNTDDDGGSYIRMYPTAFDQTSKHALFRLPPDFDFDCFPETLHLTVRVKFAGVPAGATVYPYFGLSYPNADGDFGGTHPKGFNMGSYTRPTDWATLTGSLTLTPTDRAMLQDYTSAGDAGLIVTWGPAIAGWSFYLSYAEISCPPE